MERERGSQRQAVAWQKPIVQPDCAYAAALLGQRRLMAVLLHKHMFAYQEGDWGAEGDFEGQACSHLVVCISSMLESDRR